MICCCQFAVTIKVVVIYEVRDRQIDTFLDLYAYIIYRKEQLCDKIYNSIVCHLS